MAFNWTIFRDHMVGMYHGNLGKYPCLFKGRHGEDYRNQCAIRHSNAYLQAGGQISKATADVIAPGGFFTYAGECEGASANGRQLARGAANWWAYLNRAGLVGASYRYERLTVPAAISGRSEVPFVRMTSGGSYDVSWIAEGAMTPDPARPQSVDAAEIASEMVEHPSGRANELLETYEELSRTWGELFYGESKLTRYMVMEGVWPRLIRLYLADSLGNGRGFVYYEAGGNTSDRGFHIDGFDIDFFLSGNHRTPWLGKDYSSEPTVTAVHIGMVD